MTNTVINQMDATSKPVQMARMISSLPKDSQQIAVAMITAYTDGVAAGARINKKDGTDDGSD